MGDLSASDIAALTNGNSSDGLMGNGGIWIFALLILLMLGGGGFGGTNSTGETLNRAIDLNAIQAGQQDIASDVQRTANENISAVKDASYNNLSEVRDLQAAVSSGFANMQSCCCENLRAIDSVNYNGAINKADIVAAVHAEGETTRAMIQTNKIEELQAQVNNLTMQNAINSATAGVVKYPMNSTWAMNGNPFCTGLTCSGSAY